MGTVVGCVLAVVASIGPTCISAHARTQNMLLDVVWCHGRLLEQLLDLGGAHMQEHTVVVFAEEVRGLQEQLQEIKRLLDNSWWECFGLGMAGRQGNPEAPPVGGKEMNTKSSLREFDEFIGHHK